MPEVKEIGKVYYAKFHSIPIEIEVTSEMYRSFGAKGYNNPDFHRAYESPRFNTVDGKLAIDDWVNYGEFGIVTGAELASQNSKLVRV